MFLRFSHLARGGLLWLLALQVTCAGTVRIATYNLEGYLDKPIGSRAAKSSESKRRIAQIIREVRPDVLALQEVGGHSAMQSLRDSLKAEGLQLPHSELVAGFDTNIFVAVLSRYPIVKSRPHTNQTFLLSGRRFRTQRGIAEVQIQPAPSYRFTMFVAHLKSRRPSPVADEEELRLHEARVLRGLVDRALSADPHANVVLAGDLNDVRNSRSVRELIGRGAARLIDCRPPEGRLAASGDVTVYDEVRPINWTHYFPIEDTYSRVDYILINSGMARELIRPETFVYAAPSWGLASDHRPVVATFTTEDQ